MGQSGNDAVKVGLLLGEGALDQAVIAGLAGRGVDCRVVATLTEAERTAPGAGFDLLVVDAAVYGQESPAACRRLAGNWPDCPLLLLTDPRNQVDETQLEPAWLVLPVSDRVADLLPQLLLLVSERLIAAADSAASRAVLQAVMGVVDEGLTLTDGEGRTLYENAASARAGEHVDSVPLTDEAGRFFGAVHRSRPADDFHAFEPARDPGTGLVSKDVMSECLGHALARVARSGGRCAVLLLDYLGGAPAGHEDGALRAALNVAGRKLAFQLRRGDVVARIGPTVFAIVLEGVETTAETARVAQKLLKVARLAEATPGRIGLALSPEDGSDAPALLAQAEGALAKACANGSPGYAYARDETAATIARYLALSEGLDSALARDEFRLHYQPQFDIASRAVTGFEALLRWEHGTLGPVSPAEFVPVMERNGLINDAGAWVIRRACLQLAEWQQAFARPDIHMAVNLSPIQLEDDALISVVERSMAEAGIDPGTLELEVTEGLLMKDPERAAAILKRLTRMGIPIAVDDFGTGYSSLAYIKRLPVSALKVDRTFMQGVPENEKDVSVVKGTIALAKGLDLTVTAEGVETREQVEALKRYGCDRVQGFLFGKPRSPAEASVFLARGPDED